jgi:hypothetical protein
MLELSPEDWEKRCYHERGNRPAQSFIMAAINELAIHGWDIRSKLELSARLSPEVMPLLMNRIRQRFRSPRSADFLLGSKLPARLRYHFEITRVVPGKEDIVVEGDTCWIEPAADTTADATLQYDTEIFILLMNRRMKLDSLIGSR